MQGLVVAGHGRSKRIGVPAFYTFISTTLDRSHQHFEYAYMTCPHINGLMSSVSRCSNPTCCHTHDETCPLERCSGCHAVAYCSRACQKISWPRHKKECEVWKQMKKYTGFTLATAPLLVDDIESDKGTMTMDATCLFSALTAKQATSMSFSGGAKDPTMRCQGADRLNRLKQQRRAKSALEHARLVFAKRQHALTCVPFS